MKNKEFNIELCAELIEFITTKLLDFTKNESHTLKVVKIGVQKAIDNKKTERSE